MILLEVNDEMLFIILITVAMLLVIAFFSIYLFFLFQKRKIRLLHEQQAMKENFEQEILKTQIEIRDQAMNDVGRELHDHISQVMTLIKINMNLMPDPGEGTDAGKRLAETKGLVRETINDIRMLSKTLNGEIIQQLGLLEGIRHELARINRLNINCGLEITGEEYPLPANTAFIIFRIIQENLHNTLKHSRCKKILTAVNFQPGKFSLTQQDDGIGFIVHENDKTDLGSGLLNMQRRANLINAAFSLETEPGRGTKLTLELNI